MKINFFNFEKIKNVIKFYLLTFFKFYSSLLIPGTAILPNGLLAVFYGCTLIYLFLGIGIVSDVFME